VSTDLSTTISDAAAGPKRMRTDAGEAEAHALSDLVAADRYLRQRAVSAAGVNPFKRLKKATIAFGERA